MTILSDLRPLTRVMTDVLDASKRDLRAALEALDMSSPEATRDALLEIYPALVESYGDAAGAATAEWYEGMRAGYAPGEFPAQVPEWFIQEQAEQTAKWAAGRLWGDNPMEVFSLLEGSLTRALEDVSRDTVSSNTAADPMATGWYRIASADGCDFCVMLSQRGAVYRRENAGFASHDNCSCRAAPSFDPSAPEVDVRAYEMSARRTRELAMLNDPNLSRARRKSIESAIENRRAQVRSWIDANRDQLDAFRAELI